MLLNWYKILFNNLLYFDFILNCCFSFEKWVDMKEKFQEALELIEPENNKLKKTVWGQFWSSHQRFFKYLCMACKVPYVVELARKAISNNKCVVIGLQSTGKKFLTLCKN